ncbi:hypothetical protein [Pseudomonas sp. OST1909]|uniref:hypothetical protein n=1 Tax=Pseudomonas sp. OST1909 TaxID=2777367 RepID=UPI001888D317|nr:hypothetical protein [Pseudomonas sp. OST1909]QOY72983.1 hypothetical protein IH404_07990 [Pseudomonas sp. OST1909]
MNNSFGLLVAVCCIFLLSGCDFNKDSSKSAAVVKSTRILVPALPIIQDAVFELSPLYEGRRNAEVMEQLCGVARGMIKIEQIKVFLKRKGVDAEKIANDKDQFSLLLSNDQDAQVSACAAYLATSVLTTVDVSEFARASTAASKDGVPAMSTLEVDSKLLSQALPVKLALARTNADVFSQIAVQLQKTPGLTIPQYRERAKILFSQLSPHYLSYIGDNLPLRGTQYQLVQADEHRFSFVSSAGAVFEFGIDGLVFRQNGIVWYGGGKLLGHNYALDVGRP